MIESPKQFKKVTLRKRYDLSGMDAFDENERWLASFTEGCQSVRLAGPKRTFAETFKSDQDGKEVTVSVTHSVWVRCAPAPIRRAVELAWLEKALEANAARVPDALGIAMQYVKGAPPIEHCGLKIAGDASYGPFEGNVRREGSDYHDYLGARVEYPDGTVDHPRKDEAGCLDCSGYVRMVFGYRNHLPGGDYRGLVPLSIDPASNRTLPRRAYQMYEKGPGRIIVAHSGAQVRDFSGLEVGDLVFFDGDSGDGERIDHVGIYLGLDAGERHRFISSRKIADGPTLGDRGGVSLLDGKGHYAQAFRAVRRL